MDEVDGGTTVETGGSSMVVVAGGGAGLVKGNLIVSAVERRREAGSKEVGGRLVCSISKNERKTRVRNDNLQRTTEREGGG